MDQTAEIRAEALSFDPSQIDTVLFDLDGTLLHMDMDAFVKAYFSRLGACAASEGYDPNLFLKGVWQGMKAMAANDGSKTNEEAFFAAVNELMGEDVSRSLPAFEQFYRDVFPQTACTCSPMDDTSQLITLLKKQGKRLILATNPIFPRAATMHRISWAELNPEDFELITSYENSRHAKPNPAYYQDLIDQLHLDPSRTLMVGNDLQEDLPAASLGIHLYIHDHDLINPKNRTLDDLDHGSLEKLKNWFSHENVR